MVGNNAGSIMPSTPIEDGEKQVVIYKNVCATLLMKCSLTAVRNFVRTFKMHVKHCLATKKMRVPLFEVHPGKESEENV